MDTTTTKTSGEYAVHETQQAWLLNRIAKLNRKAAKLGLPAIELNWGGEKLVPVKDRHDVLTGEVTRYLLVTVTGTAPRVNGWTLAATLQHGEEAGTVIRAVPDQQVVIPAQFRNASRFNCEHCHSVRNRKDTYLLVDASGAFKQIGTNCLADFLGGIDPHALASRAGLAFSVSEALEFAGQCGSTDNRWYLGTWLSQVAAIIRVTGKWVSKGAARAYNEKAELDGNPGISSTSSLAERVLTARTGKDWANLTEELNHSRDEILASSSDVAFAAEALTWVKETFHSKDSEDRSDFEHNLVVVTSSDSVSTRNLGLSAAAVGLYRRHLDREIEKKATEEAGRASTHLGTVGERLVFRAKALGAPRELVGNYGTTYLYKLITTEGQQLTWFASNTLEELKEGQDFVTLVGTVKKHDSFRETKQTVVTRVAVATQKQIDKVTGAVKAKKAQAKAAKVVAAQLEQLSAKDW